jgi:hypothetical protein
MTTLDNNANATQETRENKPPRLIAFNVTERGKKKFWTRIGAAWDHEDGKGLTLQLELMPVSGGRIVLREPAADEEQAKDGAGA